MDLAAGPGVDIVLSDPYTYPFEPASYDIIVSSSCFEHDQMFWLSFAEMCRTLKAGGFIYLNVPSNGTFHRYPTDNWRFYPDSGLALAAWGRRNGHDIHLIESLIGRRRRDIWNDCVMVFGKGEAPRPLSSLAEIFPRSLNIRVGEKETFTNYCEQTEDMTLRAWLTEKFRSLPSPDAGDDQTPPFEALITSLAERKSRPDARRPPPRTPRRRIDAVASLWARCGWFARSGNPTSGALGSAEQAAQSAMPRVVRASGNPRLQRPPAEQLESAAAAEPKSAPARRARNALRGCSRRRTPPI
jgi:SAM-dependent methyltransferase